MPKNYQYGIYTLMVLSGSLTKLLNEQVYLAKTQLYAASANEERDAALALIDFLESLSPKDILAHRESLKLKIAEATRAGAELEDDAAPEAEGRQQKQA